jgi:hypothetical protein
MNVDAHRLREKLKENEIQLKILTTHLKKIEDCCPHEWGKPTFVKNPDHTDEEPDITWTKMCEICGKPEFSRAFIIESELALTHQWEDYCDYET